MKGDEVGGVLARMADMRMHIVFRLGTHEEKRPLESSRRRLEDSIGMNLKENR
jgi:hypothetical protein